MSDECICKVCTEWKRLKTQKSAPIDRLHTFASVLEQNARLDERRKFENEILNKTYPYIEVRLGKEFQAAIKQGHVEYESAIWQAKLKYPKFNLSGLTAEANLILKKKVK